MSGNQQPDPDPPQPRINFGPEPGYDGASGPVPERAHLLDYVRVIYRRRWSAITVFLLIVVTVTVYTFTATPIYEAQALLLVETENPNVVSFKQVIEDKTTVDLTYYYQTQYKILRGRSLARKTLDNLKLWQHPRLTGKTGDRALLSGAVSATTTFITHLFQSPKPVETPGIEEVATQTRIVDAFLSHLIISPLRNSRLMEVKYESPDPVLAANVANALSRAYIEQNLEFKFLASKEASSWLGDRLTEQREKVEASEQALQRYREQNDAISLEERQNIVVQKLADLNTAVTRVKTERIQKEALYNQIKTIQSDRSALDTFPAVLSNSFIQQLKSDLTGLERQQGELAEKLGDRHPDMLKVKAAIQMSEAKLEGEIAKVVESVRNEYRSAEAQERSLASALEEQKREALNLNRKGIDYGALQRDAVSNHQMFENLLQRTKETGIGGELKTGNIRIVDAAEIPAVPVRPAKGANLFFAVLAGSTMAIGMALFFEYLDSRIKSPEEVKSYLRLPYLGLVPLVPEETVGANLLINESQPASFMEAFRMVRTNVLFSSAEEGGQTLVVTSTEPGEGKTLIAGNLAIALAQAGLRVLLIDADMRSPKVHTLHGLTQQPGLSNLMVGNSKASDAVRKSVTSGLWILPSGPVPPNPTELLGSKRFKDFLASVRDHFEWVVIDSPPVLAVADASVLSHSVNGVLFVVGAEMTSRRTAQTAIRQLESINARFIGVVLNRVNLIRHGYYYSAYYHSDYARYYAPSGRSQTADVVPQHVPDNPL